MTNVRLSSFESNKATLDIHSSESETESTQRHDDDNVQEALTPADLADLEKKKAEKLARQKIKKERRQQFRKDIKKAKKRDERMKCLADMMLGTVFTEKKAQRRSERSLFHVSFLEGEAMCASIEFDEEESPKQIKDPSHVPEEHNDIPWDEWEEEPLTNWWDQPDLDEVRLPCS
jgi:hypothetical protein